MTLTDSADFLPDVAGNDDDDDFERSFNPREKVDKSIQLICTGGSLRVPSPRTSLALDRSRSPFQANKVGGYVSRTKPPRSHPVSPFQRPAEGQPLPPP